MSVIHPARLLGAREIFMLKRSRERRVGLRYSDYMHNNNNYIIILLFRTAAVAAGQRGSLGPGHRGRRKGVNTKQTYSGTYILYYGQ